MIFMNFSKENSITIMKQNNSIQQEIKIMTHLVVGYPSYDVSKKIALTMLEHGADMLELQIPFSDPLADGPVIMHASDIALQNGVDVADVLRLTKDLCTQTKKPIVLMSYLNVIHAYGINRFCHDAKRSGAYGLIVPDMPIDEEQYENYYASCRKHNLHPIIVITSKSDDKRLHQISKMASGFVYCTAYQGTTGSAQSIKIELLKDIERIKKIINLPIAIGFGISTKNDIDALRSHAEIAVVGSAFIKKVQDSREEDACSNVKELLISLVGKTRT